MSIDLSFPYRLYHVISHVYTLTLVCTGILPLSETSIRALWAYYWFGHCCCPFAGIEVNHRETSQVESEKSRSEKSRNWRYRVAKSSRYLLRDRADLRESQSV